MYDPLPEPLQTHPALPLYVTLAVLAVGMFIIPFVLGVLWYVMRAKG